MVNQTTSPWTLEQHDFLVEKIAAGNSPGQIARKHPIEINYRSRSAIIGYCQRHNIQLAPSYSVKRFTWNQDLLDKLSGYYHSPRGYSIAEMATEFGITPPQISHGITLLRVRDRITTKKGNKSNHRRKADKQAWKPAGKSKPPQAITLPLDGKTASAVTIIDLEGHHCRWPVEACITGQWYCGLPRESEQTSYCRGHHVMAHRQRHNSY